MTDTAIFGVSPEGDVTPLQVRDAIAYCFASAHGEFLDMPAGTSEDAKKGMIEMFLQKAFADTGGDFQHPTKESLMHVVEYLEEFSKNFRNPEVIHTHASQIQKLIERLK